MPTTTPPTLTIEDLKIQTVEATFQAFRSAFEEAKSLAVDLSSISSVDTIGIQMLLSVQKHADRAGIALLWQSPSPAISSAIENAGIDPTFLKTSNPNET